MFLATAQLSTRRLRWLGEGYTGTEGFGVRWVLIHKTFEAMGSIIVLNMIVSKLEARENRFELKFPEALRNVP